MRLRCLLWGSCWKKLPLKLWARLAIWRSSRLQLKMKGRLALALVLVHLAAEAKRRSRGASWSAHSLHKQDLREQGLAADPSNAQEAVRYLRAASLTREPYSVYSHYGALTGYSHKVAWLISPYHAPAYSPPPSWPTSHGHNHQGRNRKEALLTSAQHKALMLLRETLMLPSHRQSTTGINIPAGALRSYCHNVSTADHHFLVDVIAQCASKVDFPMMLD
jgi:hypothetical protein